jgi:hypothetical protein
VEKAFNTPQNWKKDICLLCKVYPQLLRRESMYTVDLWYPQIYGSKETSTEENPANAQDAQSSPI